MANILPEPSQGKLSPQGAEPGSRSIPSANIWCVHHAKVGMRSHLLLGRSLSFTSLITFSGLKLQPLLPHLPVDSHEMSSRFPQGTEPICRDYLSFILEKGKKGRVVVRDKL